jgi:Pyruvate/2-oxoacid:ferredoxin oxidoreductase delta subunit
MFSGFQENPMPSKKMILSLSQLPTSPFTIDSMAWNQTGDWRYLTPLVADKMAPCSQGCPMGISIPVCLNAVKQGDLPKSLSILYDANPLPAFTGRLCYHPCQTACVRRKIDSAVSIRRMERFLSEQSSEVVIQKQAQNGKRVLVVGSGPLGLSCAYFLGRWGCHVTVQEPSAQSGGAFRDILTKKIDSQIVDAEIEKLTQLADVDIELNVSIDVDTIEDRLASFDLIVLDPTGLAGDLPCPGRSGVFNPFEKAPADGDILVPLLPEKLMPPKGPMIAYYIAAGRLTAEKGLNRVDLSGGAGGMPPGRTVKAEDIKPEMIIDSNSSRPAGGDDHPPWDQARVLREAVRCLSCGTCNMCRRCVSFCPDASINPDPDGNFVEIDLVHCKGCGICAYECPRGVITMEKNQL